LGDSRARWVVKELISYGVSPDRINFIDSEGNTAAEKAGDDPGEKNPAFRKVDITTPDRNHHWLIVMSNDTGPKLNAVAPDKIGDDSSGNGFIYLYKPSALALEGKKVTVEASEFPLRDAAASGNEIGSAESYARNLADDINANISLSLQASAAGNIVTISKNGDKFNLTLLTASTQQIRLNGTSGVTVTEQFTRSRSSTLTKQNTGNRSVAVGASLDVRYSRKFEMNVTGNSSISARLVSIPAPPQFLEAIKNFLDEE
jgi:hypothetical protein